ncbi:MAG: hypothetical protein Q7I94_02200, partial [Candidatus Contubernalis sp.]|nr:hypothetical protein [Candidatus Contubernalis sp.]
CQWYYNALKILRLLLSPYLSCQRTPTQINRILLGLSFLVLTSEGVITKEAQLLLFDGEIDSAGRFSKTHPNPRSLASLGKRRGSIENIIPQKRGGLSSFYRNVPFLLEWVVGCGYYLMGVFCGRLAEGGFPGLFLSG